MKPDDKSIRWIEEPKLGLSGKSYLPLFAEDDRARLGDDAMNGGVAHSEFRFSV